MLVIQSESSSPKVEIQYQRVVQHEGNKIAQLLLKQVFELKDDRWRGMGIIAKSGLKINEAFSSFDAEKQFTVKVPEPSEPKGCICGFDPQGIENAKRLPALC